MNSSEDIEPHDHTTRKSRQRSRTGCKTCRSRKVKCDEAPGGCKNCERLDLICPNSSPSLELSRISFTINDDEKYNKNSNSNSLPSSARAQSGLRRSRIYRSCGACRGSKSRCSGGRPVCDRCAQRGLSCVYDGKQLPDWIEASSGPLLGKKSTSDASSKGHSPTQSGQASPLQHGSAGYAGSDSSTSSTQDSNLAVDLTWLASPDLPTEEQRLSALIHEYFLNVHSLRCLAFLHKDIFECQLDDRLRPGLPEDVLLYSVCALGAKFFALRNASQEILASGFALTAGDRWAKKGLSLLFSDLGKVTVEQAMSTVLLYEHEMRMGNHASCFMLRGLGVRIYQMLGLGAEVPNDPNCQSSMLSPVMQESRRRLSWSLWAMDVALGCDSGRGPLLADSNVLIQLPCGNETFSAHVSAATKGTQQLEPLPQVAPIGAHSDEPDLQAQFIRLMSLRKQIAKQLQLQESGHASSVPGHDLDLIKIALRRWHENLPLSLQLTESAMRACRESMQLGGLVSLHVLYHHTLAEVLRMCLQLAGPGLVHQLEVQRVEQAAAVSIVMEMALRHGQEAIADPWLATAAHNSSVVLARAASGHHVALPLERPPTDLLRINLTALERMVSIHAVAKDLHNDVKGLISGTSHPISSTGAGVATGLSSPPPAPQRSPPQMVLTSASSPELPPSTRCPFGSDLGLAPTAPLASGGMDPVLTTQSTAAAGQSGPGPLSSFAEDMYRLIPDFAIANAFPGIPQQVTTDQISRGASGAFTGDEYAVMEQFMTQVFEQHSGLS